MLSPIGKLSVWILIVVGMLAASGCATRGYVRSQVQGLDPRLAEMSNADRENAERIDAVDRRAQEGITAAGAADQKATQAGAAAQQAAQAAQAADRKADTVNQAVQQTNTRVNTIENRIAALDTYTAGQPVAVIFRLNSAELSDEAKAALDQVASNVTGMRSGYMVEIQGFTDNQGSESYNFNLSQRRAESVLRYLVSKNVPLYRVSIVGLGEENPVAPNDTRQGREQNRRVEVRVLRAAGSTTNQ